MKTPFRILCAIAQDIPGVCPEPTQRDERRRAAILTAGTRIMAEQGPHTVTLTDIAAAVGIPRGTIRYIFPDLDNLLATIIKEHLRKVSAMIGDARRANPDLSTVFATSRAAYVTATRASLGGFHPAHILTVQYRHLLPPDELEGVEQCRNMIAYLVGGPDPLATLDLLDNFRFTLRQVEATLAVLEELPEPTWAETLPPPMPKTNLEREDEERRAMLAVDDELRRERENRLRGQGYTPAVSLTRARAGP